jgi:hypothetical protein
MGLFRRQRQVGPREYGAAGARYTDWLKAGFDWNLKNRTGGEFFPLHLAASFAAAHAATALLHSLPASPYFSRPGALQDEELSTLLIRMRWAMSYLLLKQTDAGEEICRAALEESAIFFSRNEEERDDARSFSGGLLEEDTWQSRVDRLGDMLISGRPAAPGRMGLIAAFITEPLKEPSDDFFGDSNRLIATNATFVIPCLDHGTEAGLQMLEEIHRKGWTQVLQELVN